jgi:hypothetical protein
MPPPALLDEFLIQIQAIGQKYILKYSIVRIVAVGIPEPLGMPLDLRRGAVEEREFAAGQQFKLIEENTDKMAV